LALAQANLAKAQADVALGDRGDELALRIQRDQLASAQRLAEWWSRVDEPNQLKQYELEVKSANDNVGDQADELEQLRRMYKSEELTNATADIVVRRAVRQYERSKEVAGIVSSRAERSRAVEVGEGRRRVADGVAQQEQALAVLESAQAQARVARRTGLVTAQAAYDAAQRKVTELKADLAAMTVTAPAAGVVYYGRLNAGAWQGNEPDVLRPGNRVQPDQVVMQVVSPGRMAVIAAVPENEIGRVRPGDPVTVTSKSFPEAPLAGKVQAIAPVASMPGDPAKFEVTVALNDTPDQPLAPGFRANVSIDVADAENVLLIPRAALGDGGRVMLVKSSPADASEREVVTGRTDGKRVEVVRGLAEGDTVLADFPSE
jgi:HlyD family secretion protein